VSYNYGSNNVSLTDVVIELINVPPSGSYSAANKYYRARYTGQYDELNSEVVLGLCSCKLPNILETQYINPEQYGISMSTACRELGIGRNIKTIRNFMKYEVIRHSIMPDLYNNDDNIEIIKEIFKHWNMHDKLEHNLDRMIHRYKIPGLKIVKLLLELFFQPPNHNSRVRFAIILQFDYHLDEKKDVISFLIDKDCIQISPQEKEKLDVYIQESGDEEMKVLLDKIPKF